MLTLPPSYLKLIQDFAPLFSQAVWPYAQALIVGAILTPGVRTVSAVLRTLGLQGERHFQTYHRVLNRAVWSSRAVSRVLLQLLVQTFAATGPLVVGLDDTIERRRGKHIQARGIYRDPVRSSHSHLVKASGLRWLSLMLLAPVPWAGRTWALPFLTLLAPSERYYAQQGRAAKKLTDWARQGLFQLRRWWPTRYLVIVADSSFAVLAFLARLQSAAQPICLLTRLRLDAALYQPAPPRSPGQRGRPRVKGARLPSLAQVATDPHTRWQRCTLADWYGQGRRTLEIVSATAVWHHSGQPAVPLRWVLIRDPQQRFKTQALLCTDVTVTPMQILQWFRWRWQLEVTFHEVRTHLGVESQRQWSAPAIARTTPALLGLFSLTTLLAHQSTQQGRLPVRQAAWYTKAHPTFVDALAVVRQTLWATGDFAVVAVENDLIKIPTALFHRLLEAVSYSGYP